ncbi:MAG: peptide-methionine (S)-S-oxide reductase, partial [Pseudomonadales bacterium]|nr:peptide-methionine (S)-S-oxide reductase [Pseudomonadales bacterium]
MNLFRKKVEMPSSERALPGREETMPVPETHYVNGQPLQPPFPEHLETAVLGL